MAILKDRRLVKLKENMSLLIRNKNKHARAYQRQSCRLFVPGTRVLAINFYKEDT